MAKRGTSDGWVSEMGKSKRERGKRGRGGISKGRVPGRHAAQAAALVGDGGSADCWCSFAPPFFFFFWNGLSSGFVFLFASVGSQASKMSLAVRRARWPPSLAAQTSLGDLWAGWLYRDVPPFFRAPLVYSEGILGGRLAEHANTAGEGEPRGG